MSDFREFIQSILLSAGVSKSHVEEITDKEGMKEYTRSFTSKSFDPKNNYEAMELMGDVTCNKIVVWLYMRKFPDLFNADKHSGSGMMNPVAIMARLKMNGVDKDTFSKFADQLGFYKWIRSSSEEKLERKSLLEDTFEAFIGCTEWLIDNKYGLHTGYAVCYEILKPLVENVEIKFEKEDLYDNKSLLNTEIHKFKGKVKISYITTETLGDPRDVEYPNTRLNTIGILTESNGVRWTSLPQITASKKEGEKLVAGYILKSDILQKLKTKYGITY